MYNLTSLHNPNKITFVYHINIGRIEPAKDQAFQEYPRRIELWQMLEGRLHRVTFWNKKNLITWG